MNSTLFKLIASGFKNWKTTVAGLVIALATVWQSGGFDSLTGKDLVTAVGAAILGYLARDANKSSQDSGIRRAILLLFLPAAFLSSCATDAVGTKTFLGVNAQGWQAIGMDVGKAAAQAAVPAYLGQRASVSSAKEARDVTP